MRDGIAWRLLDRFVIDESGNDLVEYALITGLVALLTIPALNGIQAALKSAYKSWNDAMVKCWRMPAPGKGGGC